MSPQLQSLPDELLVQVLRYVPKLHLKFARLTCSQIARTGAEWLFQRVYFAPRKSAIETFINISSNPVFARNVTELVYDGRLFLPEFKKWKSYEEAFAAFTVEEYPEEWDSVAAADECYWPHFATFKRRSTGAEYHHKSFDDFLICYTQLLGQQHRMFGRKDDYKALCAGLKNLPNITTVIVLDRFCEFRDWVPLRTDDHSWYHRRSQREVAVPVPPSSWDPEEPRLKKWDARGIQSLIRAVAQHGSHVVQLHLASEFSSVPMSTFRMDQDVCDDACKLVRRLTLLKLCLGSSAGCSKVERSEQRSRLDLILSETKNLHCLAMSGYSNIKPLKNKFWPHLEILNLGDIHLRADDLKAITQAHKDTLREVSFLNTHIRGDEAWADVAKDIGKYLRLRKIEIYGVGDEVTRRRNDSPYLEDRVSQAVARSFMQSISRTTLLVDENQVTIFACPEWSEESESRNP